MTLDADELAALRPGGYLRWYWQMMALERMGFVEHPGWIFRKGARTVRVTFPGKVEVRRNNAQ